MTAPASNPTEKAPETKQLRKAVSDMFTTTVLTRGTTERPYCAFPTIVPDGDNILIAYKQGSGHYKDEGITSFMRIKKDGTILEEGLAAAVPGFNTQNAELIALPDGSIRCYLDIQDYNQGKKRTGVVTYDYSAGKFTAREGILTDTAGLRYGYVFDAADFAGGSCMLAMTFPELASDGKQKTVELLYSADNGETWEDKVYLDRLTGLSLNESSLCAVGDKLYIFCRPYSDNCCLLVLDRDFKLLKILKYDEKADGVCKIGRPKLFFRDGALWCVLRNHKTADAPMELMMLKLDPETLVIRKQYILDDTKPSDGYYAEPYFDGDTFCVVTYKMNGAEKPDILLLRADWKKLTADEK